MAGTLDFIVVNLINMQYYSSKDVRLKTEALKKILKPSFCGLTLPDRIIVQIMKKDAGLFLKQREEYYEEWRHS